MIRPTTHFYLLCLASLSLAACSDGTTSSDGSDLDAINSDSSPVCTPDAAPSIGDLPIDVANVLISKCQPCHQSPPLNGAPFPLMSYEDTIARYNRTLKIWQRMAQVVEPTASFRMPPDGNPRPTDDELNTLRAWFRACAPPVPEGTGGDNGP